MAPVGRELAPHFGVLEPIQTATSLDGQVAELGALVAAHGDPPVALVGYSWGAWLSFILAAREPALVRKLILVSSGPFEARYVAQLRATRMARLDAGERAEFEEVVAALGAPDAGGQDALLARLGALSARSDAYDLLDDPGADSDRVGARGDLFRAVWGEAAALRRSGRLLALGQRIRCPVVAIHGDHDPHPAEGVCEPLAGVLADFRFVLLARCGHTPWRERHAREAFYAALRGELGPAL